MSHQEDNFCLIITLWHQIEGKYSKEEGFVFAKSALIGGGSGVGLLIGGGSGVGLLIGGGSGAGLLIVTRRCSGKNDNFLHLIWPMSMMIS